MVFILVNLSSNFLTLPLADGEIPNSHNCNFDMQMKEQI